MALLMNLDLKDGEKLAFEFNLFNLFQRHRDTADLELRTSTESRYYVVSRAIALNGVKEAVKSVREAIIADLDLNSLEQLKLRNYLNNL